MSKYKYTLKEPKTRYVGFVVDTTYLNDDFHQLCWADTRRRFYGDEHIMCRGVLAYTRSQLVLLRQPGWPGIYAAKQWLKLV